MMLPPMLIELLAEFADIEDARERAELLFDIADEMPELYESELNESNRIRGCQSRAHMMVTIDNDCVSIRGFADAKLVKGLMRILFLAFEGQTRASALEIQPDFIHESKLLNSITPSRANGFRNMFDYIKYQIEKD